MITDDLFDTVLVDPTRRGANLLYVVSGYASPAGVLNHLQAVPEHISVSLIIGMTGAEGLLMAHHNGFQRLVTEVFPHRLEVSYYVPSTPVHVKNYSWFLLDEPVVGFTGSANYTNAGFFSYREAVAQDDPREGRAYFNSLFPRTIDCMDRDVERSIRMYAAQPRRRPRPARAIVQALVLTAPVPGPNAEYVEMDLRDRNGTVPGRSGLNWGKRPEYNRDPNQAYIRIPAEIGRSGFFPPRGRYFTIVTDDGQSFDAVVAQDNNKAIETPKDNSLLGRYFRDRLGLPDGAEVKTIHLQAYGRNTVRFYKVDEDTYYMDFSNQNP